MSDCVYNPLEMAKAYSPNRALDDPKVDEADWELVQDFPVARLLEIMSREEWIEWFEIEYHEYTVENGFKPHWRMFLKEEITEPLVIMDNGEPSIWDGWHRSAAAVIKGVETIPAVIGHPKDLITSQKTDSDIVTTIFRS